MKVELKVPKMGESIVEANIGTLFKASGSSVKEGEEVLELETAKVNQSLTAPATGVLTLHVQQGDSVAIDQVIGVIDTEAALATVPIKQEPPPAKKEAPIVKKQEVSLPPPPPPAPPRSSAKETRTKMSSLRKVIAQRLVQVKNETAMLTTFNEVDMHSIMKIRSENQESFQKKYGVKLGFMSFFVKATVSALQQFPELNARIEGDEIVYHHFYDIGIAVGTDKGLFVPIVRNADLLSFAEIEKSIKTYADKAQNGTITIDEMQGGTFTITNGGTFGSMLSTPILNPPQSGILGMHNIVKRAVVLEDEIVIRPIMYLALSYDHRIVDGKQSISFLMHIKKILEEPARFLLDL